MQFNSVIFLLFFSLFFVLYWSLSNRLKIQNCLLLTGSYLFYGWWDYRFLSLILLTTVVTYASALKSRESHPRLWTTLSIAINLALLFLFKYFNFFSDNLARLMSLFGWNLDWFTIDVLLPIGISFYTFQAIAYSVDVYRHDIEPERNFINFSTFIAFFPQLMAGPIERACQLMPQIDTQRRWDSDLATQGAREVLWGLFKKVAVADMCGIYVDIFYGTPNQTSLKLSLAAILFMFQIYCDFSGYCNIARGLAAMLGIRLSVNFHYPLFSRNPREFWSRWHITLTNWLRDYIYFPLGGSHCSRWRTVLNIFIVFLISGVWHGASWNFIVWGALWGIIMIVYRNFGRRVLPNTELSQQTVADITRITLMGFVMTYILIFFRITNITEAFEVALKALPYLTIAAAGVWITWTVVRRIKHLLLLTIVIAFIALAIISGVYGSSIAIPLFLKGSMAICGVVVLLVEWRAREFTFALEQMPKGSQWKRISIYWLLIFAIIISNSTGNNFIYFQF